MNSDSHYNPCNDALKSVCSIITLMMACLGFRLHFLTLVMACPGFGSRFLTLVMACLGFGSHFLTLVMACPGFGLRFLTLVMACLGFGSRFLTLMMACPGFQAIRYKACDGSRSRRAVHPYAHNNVFPLLSLLSLVC